MFWNKKTKEEKVEEALKIVSIIPFSEITALTGKLIRYSKGGISREEGAELLKDLVKLIEHLGEQLKKSTSEEEQKVPKKKKRETLLEL